MRAEIHERQAMRCEKHGGSGIEESFGGGEPGFGFLPELPVSVDPGVEALRDPALRMNENLLGRAAFGRIRRR